jgi:hypothetical protein
MSENVSDNLFVMGDPVALYAAIAKASVNFDDVPKPKAGQIGNQKFVYAPYHVIRKCILKHLAAEGVGMVQPMHTVGDKAAVSLIVSGHGAAITSRMVFPLDTNVQIFGKESTYFRRYQLQAFFCLEGEKDADDPDDVAENPAKVVKTNGPSGKQADKPAVQSDSSASKSGKPDVVETKAAPVAEPSVAKEESAKAVEAKPESKVLSPNDRLMSAKAQLGWKFEQFDEYCQKNIEKFPGFVACSKMTNDLKVKLHEMLVAEFSLAPF